MPKRSTKTAHTKGHHQRGAAALEYILVSTFAAVVALAALGFIGKVVRQQLTTMATKLGISEVPEISLPYPASP